MKDYKIIKPRCWICGKKFKVRIRNDGKIMSPCFHSYIRKHFFMGWSYGFKSLKKKDIWNKNNRTIHFKNTFFKILGFTEFQRRIVYELWNLFHNGKLEYWECPKCCKEGNKEQ